ncbi:TetR/AcrR family transcriptional regulator [Anaerosphaera multitolerans]|uniref:TetR/AcrR family transcriptional regulator n=1 Tax=Anaerosphaera multitolerans TaxID=2487351 RepID=A0A437S7S0_9FIRM|nr:TetR/AcrR family transcriptional regulator [Anaerosphaera multitolerans]RVU54981.1 TetR/AcrR family transcriptional regulator [Anaerosphaera multitolerans]
MYEGNNPTAVKSQKNFAYSLFKLMEEKPLNKITVKNICEESNLSRQTFYQLFTTKEDVIRYYIRESLRKVQIDIDESFEKNIKGMIKVYLRFLIDNEDIFKLLMDNKVAYLFIEEFAIRIKEIGNKINGDNFGEYSEYIVAFVTGGIFSTIFYWLKSNKEIGEEKLIELIAKMLTLQIEI